MVVSSGRLWVGVAGLLVFLFGFELAFVTSLSLVSEAMPDARGTTLAISNAVGTVARATGAVASGWLYSVHGVNGNGVVGCARGADLRRVPAPQPSATLRWREPIPRRSSAATNGRTAPATGSAWVCGPAWPAPGIISERQSGDHLRQPLHRGAMMGRPNSP
jgi:MFS family permease